MNKPNLIAISLLTILFFVTQNSTFAQKQMAPPKAITCVKADGNKLKVTDKSKKNVSTQGTTILYSHGDPTDEEQLMLEYINRARANPKAEGERLFNTTDPEVRSAISYFNINMTQIKNEFAGYPARPPLAMNKELTDAARGHCEDMGTNNFQGHDGSDGSNLMDRASRAGYPGSFLGENVFAYMKSVWHGHCGFNIDWGNAEPGHRKNIMNYTNDYGVYREVGIGIIHKSGGSTGPLICTEDFGTAADYFVLGVVYKDKNSNNFYDIGEGLSGVSISLNKGSYSAVTSKSGGYAIPLSSITGSVTVTASGGGLLEPQTRTISVTKDMNVKVDFGNPVAFEPFLLQPPHNASIPVDTVRFVWQKNNSVPTTFKFQCAKDSNFTQIVFADSNKTDTFKVMKNLTLYQTYYWRVQAKNQYGYSDYSPTQIFKYTLSPSPVTVLEPVSGFESTTDVVKFVWLKATPSIQSYSLEVYEDAGCTQLYTFKTNIPDTTVTLKDFEFGKKYWWKVKAKNQGGFGEFGNTNWFQYGTTPSTITRMKPTDNASIPLSNAAFSWESTTPKATNYHFEIYDDSTMQDIPLYFSTMITDTFKQAEFDWGLENGKSYFWRVRGIIGNLKGNWSPLIKVNIGIKPSVVTNLSPASGVVLPFNILKFSWAKPTPTPEKYWLEINEDSTFKSTPTYFAPSIILTSITPQQSWGLQNKKTYWWRVKNSISSVWSDWSVANKFTIDNNLGSVDEQENKFEFSLLNNVVNNKLQLNFKNVSLSQKTMSYRIFNSIGETVLSENMNVNYGNINEIDLSNLPSGNFTISVQVSNYAASKQFIIVR